MIHTVSRRRRALTAAFAGIVVATAASQVLAGAYVDNALGDVSADQWAKVAAPQPVQLLFEFETNGAPNPRATKFLADKVTETVKSSGLFSQILDTPATSGALLHVVINDVADSGARAHAEGKGFVTGLSLGLVGSTIAETYECKVEFAAGPSSDKIVKTARHKLYTQLGLTAQAPANATKVANTREAIYTVARQCVANPLNAVAQEPAFGGVSLAGGAAPTASLAPPAPNAPQTAAESPSAGSPVSDAPKPNAAPAAAPGSSL